MINDALHFILLLYVGKVINTLVQKMNNDTKRMSHEDSKDDNDDILYLTFYDIDYHRQKYAMHVF